MAVEFDIQDDYQHIKIEVFDRVLHYQMGLLDFVVHKGTLFTNNEIEYDKHFIIFLNS